MIEETLPTQYDLQGWMDLGKAKESSWERLKRLVRYLYHTRKLATFYPWGNGKPPRDLVAYSDSYWAGDTRTRKSTSCCVLYLDEYVLATVVR